MANGHGGARIGAGQKKKPLSDKIAEGNPGKRKLTVLDFTADAADLKGPAHAAAQGVSHRPAKERQEHAGRERIRGNVEMAV